MHEISICQNIINTVLSEMERDELENIIEIRLSVGELACVQPAVLKQVFSFMKAETDLKNSELEIDWLNILVECEKCNINFEVKEYNFVCPECNTPSSKIIQGKELLIKKITLMQNANEKVEH